MRAIGIVVVWALAGCGGELVADRPLDASPPPTDSGFFVDLSIVKTLDAPIADAGVFSPADVVAVPADVVTASEAAVDGGATGCGARMGRAGDTTITLRSGGRDRRMLVHVPASYDGTRPVPVVMNLHGLFGTGMAQAETTGMIAASNRRGFIAVHPDGVGTSWNAGNCCTPADASGVNDVAFVADALTRVEQDWCVDRRREFVTGFSNGGMMSHRAACALADRVAAIAAVSGVIMTSPCTPSRPVPVLHIHGTNDLVVGYNGNPLLRQTPVADTIRAWEERNGCTDTAPTLVSNAGSVLCLARRRCRGESEVELCTITGGGHTWPRAPFDATEHVLDFFARHPMP